jgi:DNA-directed RNA polymerase specialized sigma24 family protein
VRQKKWEAYEEFVRTHGDSLVRLSYVLCGDRGKAEDAAQEAPPRADLPGRRN